MYGSARELFGAAMEAARDAERISRQLEALDEGSDGLTAGDFEPRVRRTSDPGRMASMVARRIEQRARLEERQDEDYRLIDRACELLYGPDNHGGLYSLVGWPADAIYHHYLALRTWEEVGRIMAYHPRYVKERVAWAMDLADANGEMWTRLGQGMAEA